ncbi:tryptophan synthase beta subunit-like PLP-dependent enzyme [Aspergillus pseudotamarii]|uniref:L-serine ammonia-lyase n=1 Tax=Aspergillus pseudotamarii TaxID=132259 RepID=A0A5N6SI04_ASPPS|nr:tryptophan synthase beta subunit-like PLP-dependent enzyme [Aspergillus pseudotamarii]KAE8133291.1 tryptophan synthase beta subunit-like PLP-dependent enzyme [Aspergillus pseudotamarii]
MANSHLTQRKPWIETPLIESATLSKAAGCRVFLKLELLQPSGSFKSRGIGNLIRSALLDPANKNKELHFYSSSGGNAGLAAVIAARDLGCPCTVVVPHSTKPLMISKLRAAGATDVIQHGSSWFEADTYLRQNFIDKNRDEEDADAAKKRNIYVPPFDHPDIWKGAGTMVSELATQLPPRDTPAGYTFPADAIVCSVGGGGLFNGIVEGLGDYMRSYPTPDLVTGTTLKNVRVLAAETNGADSLALSLRSGSLESLPAITSLATSLGALCVAPQTLKNAQSPPAGVDVVSVVGSDAEAAKGIIHLADELRLQVELACGISVEIAAGSRLREAVPDLTPDSRVVVVVCGGSNITAEMIAEYRQRLQNGWE